MQQCSPNPYRGLAAQHPAPPALLVKPQTGRNALTSFFRPFPCKYTESLLPVIGDYGAFTQLS